VRFWEKTGLRERNPHLKTSCLVCVKSFLIFCRFSVSRRILNKNVTKFRRRNFDVLQQSLLRIIRWQLRAAPPQRRCWKELQVGTWMHWQSKHSIAWQIFITASRLETSCKWIQVRGQCRGSANFESGCGVGVVFCVGQRTLINVAT